MLGGRRKAREILFRVMYEVEISHEDTLEALEYSFGRYHLTEDARDYATGLIRELRDRAAEIDQKIELLLERWTLARLSAVVRSILRLAALELMVGDDVPAPVILDQAIVLAQRYGEDGADGFVNGVLDKLAREFRPEEMDRMKKGAK